MAGPRILVTALGHIADTLTATPAVHALRVAHPEARIAVLILEAVEPLWRHCPDVNEIITVSDRRHGGRRGQAERLVVVARLLPRLWRRFDQVLVLQAGGAANLIAFLTGAPVRAGFNRGPARRLLTTVVPVDERESLREANVRAVRALEVESPDSRLRLTLDTADLRAAEAVIAQLGARGRGPLIGLHPGSDWGCQMWGFEQWAQVGDHLAKRWGARLIITGTERERWIAERIAALMECRPAIACGRTSLPQLAAIIKRMDLLVGVESGPVALAVAAGTPVVALEALYYAFERAPWGRLPGDEVVSQIIERDDGQHRWYGDCRLAKLKRERGCINPACIGGGVMGRIQATAVIEASDAVLAAGVPGTGTGAEKG